jgi:hypothetical protein
LEALGAVLAAVAVGRVVGRVAAARVAAAKVAAAKVVVVREVEVAAVGREEDWDPGKAWSKPRIDCLPPWIHDTDIRLKQSLCLNNQCQH